MKKSGGTSLLQTTTTLKKTGGTSLPQTTTTLKNLVALVFFKQPLT